MPDNPGSRQASRVLVTPLVADVLFFELQKNVDRINPKGSTFPNSYGATYASLHANSTIYPNHKLVLVEDADDQGLQQRWWYAADRSSQESYNAAITWPYHGNVNYPRITREYILPRAEGEVPLALGTPDPGTQGIISYQLIQPYPATIADGAILQPSPSTDGIFSPLDVTSSAVLVAQSEEPLPYDSKISSLYVKVTRVYDIIPGTDDGTPGSGASQVDAGYTVERPLGTADFFRLTWKLTLPRTIADNNKSTDYKPCPIPGYTNLLLVNETIKANDGTNQTSTITRVYEGNLTGAPFPSATSVIYQGKFYPGTLPPDKFVVSKRKVVDIVYTDDSADENVSTPAVSPEQSALPLHDALESVEAKPRGDTPATTGTKEITYWTDIQIATLAGERWDDNIRDYVPFTTFVMPAADYPNIGAPATGTQRDVVPLGTGWVMVTIQAPRETTIEVIASPFIPQDAPRTYISTMNDFWPNVLFSLNIFLTPDGDALDYDYEFKPRAYNGPCRAYFQVAWQKTQPLVGITTNLTPEAFDPTSLAISWTGVLNLRIPECLHFNANETTAGLEGAYIFTITGTNYYKAWMPTSFHTWPDSYVKSVRCEPYLGGFRIEKVTVLQPSFG